MDEELPGGLLEADLPAPYQAADEASRAGRRIYIRITIARLTLLMLGAVGGAFAFTWRHTDVIALGIVAVISAGFVMQRDHLQGKSWIAWREGDRIKVRAGSLGWRYAMGASPFPVGFEPGAEEEAKQRLYNDLSRLLEHAPQGSLTAAHGVAISQRMQKLRIVPLQQRKDVYLNFRITRELQRHRDLAERERRRMSHLWWTFSSLEIFCVCAALIRALDIISFNLPGMLAAAVAVGAVWLSVKQHDKLAENYSLASNRLAIRLIRLEQAANDLEWAREAGYAEDIITGEYATWYETRSEFQPF